MINFSKLKIIFIFLFIFLLLPAATKASILYLEPASGNYGFGDEFVVAIKLDIGEYCINTIEASIKFSQDLARLVDFSTGESFLHLWIDRPSTRDIIDINKKGVIHFAGGIPGGYCGKIPGDPGISNIVGKLYLNIPSFSVSDSDKDIIVLDFVDTTRVLLNDGLGTADTLITKGAQFAVSRQLGLPKTDWEDQLKKDTIPPEPFNVELHKNPTLFNGQYYIMFTTTDKQTGIDHYEVLEIKPGEQLNVVPKRKFIDIILRRKKSPPQWKVTKPPYLLRDQSLQSVIKVKAIDKAANERIVEYIPTELKPEVKVYNWWWILIIAFIVIFIIILSWIIIHKFLSRRKNEHS